MPSAQSGQKLSVLTLKNRKDEGRKKNSPLETHQWDGFARDLIQAERTSVNLDQPRKPHRVSSLKSLKHGPKEGPSLKIVANHEDFAEISDLTFSSPGKESKKN